MKSQIIFSVSFNLAYRYHVYNAVDDYRVVLFVDVLNILQSNTSNLLYIEWFKIPQITITNIIFLSLVYILYFSSYGNRYQTCQTKNWNLLRLILVIGSFNILPERCGFVLHIYSCNIRYHLHTNYW